MRQLISHNLELIGAILRRDHTSHFTSKMQVGTNSNDLEQVLHTKFSNFFSISQPKYHVRSVMFKSDMKKDILEGYYYCWNRS